MQLHDLDCSPRACCMTDLEQQVTAMQKHHVTSCSCFCSIVPVQVVMAFEEEFGIEIPDSEADKILSTQVPTSYCSSRALSVRPCTW